MNDANALRSGIGMLRAGILIFTVGMLATVWMAVEWVTHPRALNSFSGMRVYYFEGQPYSYPDFDLGAMPTVVGVGLVVTIAGILTLAISRRPTGAR